MLEDFLRPNGITFDQFCDEYRGSWLFAYVDALHSAGLRPLLVIVSDGVTEVTRRTHRLTGVPICVLPVPRAYRVLRAPMRSPYARTFGRAFRGPRALALGLSPLLAPARQVAPYLSTPLRALERELERERCRIVLCQEYEFPRFDLCVARGARRGWSVFGTFQGGDYRHWASESLVRPWSIRHAAGLIVGAGAELERVRSTYGAVRVAPIPNPIDLGVWRPGDRAAARERLGLPQATRVAAWHGRVELWKKGLDVLLEAWARVPEDCTLLLVGAGPDTGKVRALIDGRRTRNVVWVDRYVHERHELAELLSAADLYVFSSRHEGFPVAPLEAMAVGLPVVTTDVAGIRDVLEDGEASGGVVVPADDPAALAREVTRLLGDPERCRELGAAARTRAEGYGVEAIGARLASFLLGGE